MVVLLSGVGSLCAALLKVRRAAFTVVAVGADREAAGLAAPREQGVSTFVVRPADSPDRVAWDRALAAAIAEHSPDLVVCAGFMRIVGPAVLEAFGGRIINSHPSLLPAFPGAHAVRDALAAGMTTTGATVHQVDAGLDTGPVIAQTPVPILPGDDEARLHERIKAVERDLLVSTVTALSTTIAPLSQDREPPDE